VRRFLRDGVECVNGSDDQCVVTVNCCCVGDQLRVPVHTNDERARTWTTLVGGATHSREKWVQLHGPGL